MLRISDTESPSGSVTLRLDGQVSGPWVAELEHSCEQVLAQGTPLVLDLAGVSFASSQGVAFLRSLAGRGVALTNTSLFMAKVLKT